MSTRPHLFYLILTAGIFISLHLVHASVPANDNFANAQSLASQTNVSATGTIISSTAESGDPHGAVLSVWYKWTAPQTGSVFLDVAHASTAIDGAVFQGSNLSSGQYLVSGPISFGDSLHFNATGGSTYYVCIYNGNSNATDFTLNLYEPVNDAFANAIALPSATTVNIDGFNDFATYEPGDPANNDDRTVWYSWTAPRSGKVSISIASDTAKFVAVMVGSNPLSGSYFAGSIDGDSEAGPATDKTTEFYANANQVYYFCIYGEGDLFSLGLNCDASLSSDALFVYPNSNDNFSDALVVTDPNATVVLHLLNATFEPFEQDMLHTVHASFFSSAEGGIWIKYTPPADGTVTFTAQNIAESEPVLIVGTGDSIADLTLLAAGSGGCRFNAQAGTAYRLYVFSQYGTYPKYIKTTEVVASISLQGAKNTSTGVFARQAGIFEGVAGDGSWLKLSVSSSGSFTGKLVVNGITYTLKGKFGSDGKFTGQFGGLIVSLHIDASASEPNAGDYIVSGTAGSAALTLNHAAYKKGQTLSDLGKYTILLNPNDTGATIPQGTAFATLTVSKTGSVSVTGKLADGHSFSAGTVLIGGSSGNQCGIFSSLKYPSLQTKGTKGYLLGNVTFESSAGEDLDGTWQWVKPQQVTNTYPASIDTNLNAVGSVYSNPEGQSVLPGFTNGTLTFSDSGAFDTPLEKTVTLTTANTFIVTNADDDKLKVKISKSNGRLNGSFLYPNLKKPVQFSGALLQSGVSGGGFFVGPNGSGKVTLKSTP